MSQRDLLVIIFLKNLYKVSAKQRILKGLISISFIMLIANTGLIAQTTVNLAPCTNCSADTLCLPTKYAGSLGGSTDFSTVSTTAGAPTNLGSTFSFTLPNDSWVNLQFSGSTGQTGGAAANENTQIIFYLLLDGSNIQTSSNDATGQHGSLADNRTINYNIDLDNWQFLSAGTHTLDLGAVRHANLDRGVISGNFIVMAFPECGFGGGGDNGAGSATTDTLYIASDTCVAARVLHDAAQNIAAATTTQLNFGTESYDLGNNFSANQFTVVEDGLYFINSQASILLPGENDWTRLFINKNGAAIAQETENNGRAANSSVGVAVNTTVFLTAGDVINSSIFATSAAPTQAGRGYFEIRRVDCGDGVSAGSSGSGGTGNPITSFAPNATEDSLIITLQDGTTLIAPSGTGASTTDTLYIASDTCVAARILHSAAQNIVASTTTQLNFGTESYDLGNNFSGNQFTVVEDGLYFINVQASVLLPGENDWTRLFILENGVSIASETENNGRTVNSSVGVAVNTTVFLTAGDVITSSIFTTSAAPTQANRGYFEIRRVDCGDGVSGGSGAVQTLAYDPATDSLTISGGNTISITPTPTYGMDFLDAQLDVTAEAPTYESTTTTITLPSAGIYRVSLNAHGQVRTTAVNPSTLMAQMYDVTNATSLGIFPVVGADEAGSNILGGSSYETFLTVTGPTVIEARVAATNQTAADVVRLRTTTQLLYQKLD